MAKQLNDALVRVLDRVSKRLAIRFEVDGLKKSLKQARTSIHNLPKRDKTGTPDKEKTAFPYLFLDLRNRSRINKFARAKMDDILKSAVRPEQAKVVDSELDQWISEATGQSVTLIDDEDTPSPLPRKSRSSGKSVATPKGGSLGRRRRRPVDETPTWGGRPEVTATGTGKRVRFGGNDGIEPGEGTEGMSPPTPAAKSDQGGTVTATALDDGKSPQGQDHSLENKTVETPRGQEQEPVTPGQGDDNHTGDVPGDSAVGTGVRDDDGMTDDMEERDVPVHLLPWYIRTIRKLTS